MEINTAAKAELRAQLWRENPLDPHLWRNFILGYNALIGQVGGYVAPLANLALRLPPVRILMEKALGIDRHAPFPQFSFATFRGWFYGVHRRRSAPPSPTSTRGPVVYFHGCATNYYDLDVGKAIVAVLEHNGFEVLLPEQNCCGLPMQSNGDLAGARRMARDNIRKLEPYARQNIPILVGGTSCGLALKSDYREILGIHTKAAQILAENVYDICEFLWLEYEAGRLQTDFAPQERLLPYHTSCHQKLHGMGRPALDLLNLVPGIQAQDMGADCCGITGTYGYKHEKYAIAQAVGKPLFERIRATGAPVAVCDNETCRWNIAASAGVRVVHTAQIMAQAYGLLR
jgi:glycerol-3-phosphate dehydrogenase subunit C